MTKSAGNNQDEDAITKAVDEIFEQFEIGIFPEMDPELHALDGEEITIDYLKVRARDTLIGAFCALNEVDDELQQFNTEESRELSGIMWKTLTTFVERFLLKRADCLKEGQEFKRSYFYGFRSWPFNGDPENQITEFPSAGYILSMPKWATETLFWPSKVIDDSVNKDEKGRPRVIIQLYKQDIYHVCSDVPVDYIILRQKTGDNMP